MHAPSTSISSPLRIDAVTVPGGTGQVGMTLLPGRYDDLSPHFSWRRDLEADLDEIAFWSPRLVITLVEEHEFATSGMPDFAQRMRAFERRSGIAWAHLPMRDGSAGGRAFAAAWPRVGADAGEILRRGGRVLVHCRAGLGRTGTVAAMLLIELGMAPEAALAAVRDGRPRRVETPQQVAAVLAHRAGASVAMPVRRMTAVP